MKFVIAVVMLALAVGVNSSLLGLYPGSLAAHGAYGPIGPYGPAAVDISAHGIYGGIPSYYGGIPGISLSQGPIYGHGIAAHVAAPLPLAHGHSGPGVYVAKTRGAIHTAPLAGHINSATSLNLAPAPGTH